MCLRFITIIFFNPQAKHIWFGFCFFLIMPTKMIKSAGAILFEDRLREFQILQSEEKKATRRP